MYRKKYSFVTGLLLAVLCLTACKAQKPSSQGTTPTGNVNPTDTVTMEATGTPTPTATVTPTPKAAPTFAQTTPIPTLPAFDDSTPHIVWALHFSGSASEEVQAEIQDFLNGKGIDCRIDFIKDANVLCGTEFGKWIDAQQEANRAPDIVNSNAWETTTLTFEFVEQKLSPLNDLLETEVGKELYDAYSEWEWKKIEVNGNIYTMPWRRETIDNGRFLYVNNQYLDTFQKLYDGTYESLRSAMQSVSDEELILASEYLGDEFFAFKGYQVLWEMDCLYEDNDTPVEVVDLTDEPGIEEFVRTIYHDYRDGVLKPFVKPEEVTDDVFAYFTKGKIDGIEGFTEVVVLPDLCLCSTGMAYGILNSSTRKELAFQVLAACYSDPRIASLLYLGYEDVELWNERDAYKRTCETSSITGYVPYYTEEEWELLHAYNLEVGNLFSKMYNESGMSYYINKNYETYLDSYFSRPRDHSEILNPVKQKIAKWYESKKEQK